VLEVDSLPTLLADTAETVTRVAWMFGLPTPAEITKAAAILEPTAEFLPTPIPTVAEPIAVDAALA